MTKGTGLTNGESVSEALVNAKLGGA
jgi:hypothetical protein